MTLPLWWWKWSFRKPATRNLLSWNYPTKPSGCNFRRLLQQTALLRGPHQWCAVPCDCSQWGKFEPSFVTFSTCHVPCFTKKHTIFSASNVFLWGDAIFAARFLVNSHNASASKSLDKNRGECEPLSLCLWRLGNDMDVKVAKARGESEDTPQKLQKPLSPACIQRTSPFQMQIWRYLARSSTGVMLARCGRRECAYQGSRLRASWSLRNGQPYKIIIVEEDEDKERLAQAMGGPNPDHVRSSSLSCGFCSRPWCDPLGENPAKLESGPALQGSQRPSSPVIHGSREERHACSWPFHPVSNCLWPGHVRPMEGWKPVAGVAGVASWWPSRPIWCHHCSCRWLWRNCFLGFQEVRMEGHLCFQSHFLKA